MYYRIFEHKVSSEGHLVQPPCTSMVSQSRLSWLYPLGFWISLWIETTQPLWETCDNVWLSLQQNRFFLWLNSIFWVSFCVHSSCHWKSLKNCLATSSLPPPIRLLFHLLFLLLFLYASVVEDFLYLQKWSAHTWVTLVWNMTLISWNSDSDSCSLQDLSAPTWDLLLCKYFFYPCNITLQVWHFSMRMTGTNVPFEKSFLCGSWMMSTYDTWTGIRTLGFCSLSQIFCMTLNVSLATDQKPAGSLLICLNGLWIRCLTFSDSLTNLYKGAGVICLSHRAVTKWNTLLQRSLGSLSRESYSSAKHYINLSKQ